MILTGKIIKIPKFVMIFARKINRIAEFYMIFARKMPEFHVIIAGKNIFFGGGACLLPPPPIRLCRPLDPIPPFVNGWTMAIAALFKAYRRPW